MRRSLCRSCLMLAAIGLVLSSAVNTAAQGRTQGKVTDEWDNPLEGVTVLAEPDGGAGGSQTTTTDDDGEFMFIGLNRGQWGFTVTLDGYQGVRGVTEVRQLNSNRPMEFELEALPSGGRFRERTEFEAEGGTPRFRFEEDGLFEFEDGEGEGEGTYGIAEQTAVLLVRDYDGPDDRFSVSTPVVVTFGDAMFTSMTHDGVQLMKK